MGPTLPLSQELHATKYRQTGESFEDMCSRYAGAVFSDDNTMRRLLKDSLLRQRILPAGRQQAAVGAARAVTPFNCFVSGAIEDSMDSIMTNAKEAAETLRLGGGVGFDFSRIRPKNERINGIGDGAFSSGPVSFMDIFDVVCGTVASAGYRSGALMGVLRVDHPDIEDFVRAKHPPSGQVVRYGEGRLRRFNLSVGITDEFMRAVENDSDFSLRFGGRHYSMVKARYLWELIMRSTWDHAEPGVLFLDTINRMNNLSYMETIAATNPCGEQPLPPNGACLLGSLNLVKFLFRLSTRSSQQVFNFDALDTNTRLMVRAFNRVIDIATYPLKEQEIESQLKRRMGIGITGFANASEILGFPYGTPTSIHFLKKVLTIVRDAAYGESILLAKKDGPFPGWDRRMLSSGFCQTLPEDIREDIGRYGIRNSHLLSIAPTGTISLTADNVSSGIEPPWRLRSVRKITTAEGVRDEVLEDYAFREYGVSGRTAAGITPEQHLSVLKTAAGLVDSAVSKTINCPYDISWQSFKDIYMDAWRHGIKGCTTFREGGLREGILTEISDGVCTIDPDTGIKTCSL